MDGRKDSTKYQQTLEANIRLSVKKLKHGEDGFLRGITIGNKTLKSTMPHFKSCNLKVLEWPSHSSDLNIIKNLGLDLKRALHPRQPENLQN